MAVALGGEKNPPERGALLLGRGRQTREACTHAPACPALPRVLSQRLHARAKASSPATKPVSQGAWEAASTQRHCRSTIVLAQPQPQAVERGGACPAMGCRAARTSSPSNAAVVQGSASQARAAPCAEHAGVSSTCDVPHSWKCCAAALTSALWVELADCARAACCLWPSTGSSPPCCCARRNGVPSCLALSCQLITDRMGSPRTIHSLTSTFHAPSRVARWRCLDAHASNDSTASALAPPAATTGTASPVGGVPIQNSKRRQAFFSFFEKN